MSKTQDSWHRIEKGLTIQRPNAVIIDLPQCKFINDIDKWVDENCEPPYSRIGREFIFNNERDTMMFILRWS
jgi:hypothetical protein